VGRAGAFVAAFVVSCASPDGAAIDHPFDACAPLRLDAAGATDAQLAAIDRAIDDWAAVGLRAPSRTAAAGATVRVAFVDGPPDDYGFFDGAAATIYVNRALDGEPGAITIAHELGHVFGLIHVAPAVRASVMNPGNLTTLPTTDDLGAITARWGACAP
jgi:hypothetical protein